MIRWFISYDCRWKSSKKRNKPTEPEGNFAHPEPTQAGPSRPDTSPFPRAQPIDPKRVQQFGRAKVWAFYKHNPITNENVCTTCGRKTLDKKPYNLESHLKCNPYIPVNIQQHIDRSVSALVSWSEFASWFAMCDIQFNIYETELASMTEQQLAVPAVEFWKTKSHGTLAPVARFALSHILCVPPSTACVERLFSMASLVQHTNRLRLSGLMTENELMLRLNCDYIDAWLEITCLYRIKKHVKILNNCSDFRFQS